MNANLAAKNNTWRLALRADCAAALIAKQPASNAAYYYFYFSKQHKAFGSVS